MSRDTPNANRPLVSDTWAVLLVVITWAAVLYRQLFLAESVFVGDSAWVFFPLRALGAARLQHGELGVWNPHVFGGLPFAADPQSQVFYPFHLLLLLLPTAAAMSASLAIHYLMLLGGSYLLARYSLRVGPLPAAVFALSFGLCGPALTRSLVPCYPEALAWLPWALASLDWALRGGSIVRILMAALVVALQVLVGAPQYSYYTLLAMVAVAAWRFAQTPSPVLRRRALVAIPLTSVLAVALAMVQVLPTTEMARLTDRASRSGYEFATTFSLPVGQFAETLLYPRMYGSAEAPEAHGFAVGEYLGYVGGITLSLACVAMVGASRRRLVLALLGAAGVSVFLAAGADNPLYPLLYRVAPGLSLFRCPARFIGSVDK